jgi:23S rRNA maturation-related 3'-5' exoribonuclease YhaM
LENNLASHTPNLGKLSIALLEHLVEPLLGDSAIQEIKSPVKQKELFDAISKALVATENRFVNEHVNKDISSVKYPFYGSPALYVKIKVGQELLDEANQN